MTQIKEKRKYSLSNRIAKILLFIFSVLFVVSCYAHFFYKPSTANPEVVNNPTPAPTSVPIQSSQTLKPLSSEFTDQNSLLVYVSQAHPLPSDFVPASLGTPHLPSTGAVVEIQEEAGKKAQEMLAQAKREGYELFVSAGYRSYKNQEELYNNRVSLVGEQKASLTVEKAGCSEHQIGLAIDITDDPTGTVLNEEFEKKECAQWLFEHAHEYGFILRYPKNKEKITGLSYQPWHYRYVGVDTATAMYEKDPNITFEEYFELIEE